MRRWILLGIFVMTASWGGWTLFQRHREAVQRERDDAERRRESAFLTDYQRGSEVFYGADFAKAEKLLTDLLPECEKRHPNDRYLADLLSMIGMSYRMEQKYDQAEPVLKRALEVYDRIAPSGLIGAERTETILGAVYVDRQDYVSAEPHFSKALAISDKIPGAPKFELGVTLVYLGYLRMVQGRYREAEQILNNSIEALSSDSTQWGQTNLANAFYRLGGVYAMEHRYRDAKQQYSKALQIQEKLSPNSREVGFTLEGLGQAYQGEGNISKAAELLNRAQEIAQHSDVPEEDARGAIFLARGEAAQNQGNYVQAESLYQQAIDIDEKTLGPEHLDLALALVYLGCLYRDEEQFDITKADPLLERALSIRQKALGPEHPTTANTLSDLSLLRFYERKFEEAERFAKQALPIQEKVYGHESLEVSTTLNRLGLAERDLRKLAEAEGSLKRALNIRERDLPSNHTWIAISLENLASVYLAQGQTDKAVPLLTRAKAIRSRPVP